MTLNDVITMIEDARNECNQAITQSPSCNEWYRGKKSAYNEVITLLYNLKYEEVKP